jgi:hypothetical protein
MAAVEEDTCMAGADELTCIIADAVAPALAFIIASGDDCIIALELTQLSRPGRDDELVDAVPSVVPVAVQAANASVAANVKGMNLRMYVQG